MEGNFVQYSKQLSVPIPNTVFTSRERNTNKSVSSLIKSIVKQVSIAKSWNNGWTECNILWNWKYNIFAYKTMYFRCMVRLFKQINI